VSPSGPTAYLNWLASQNSPLFFTHEFPLYSDAHIISEAEFGPYRFFNTVAIPTPGAVRQKVALRWDWHWEYQVPTFQKTEADQYHGGGPAEEIAALASLALGVRFRSGDATRDFSPNGDPKGRPIALTLRAAPTLVKTESREGWILPHAAEGQHSLELLAPLATLPRLKPEAATSLIRSARLYQDALWLAESEPALSWLLLVSAVETGAVYWRAEKEPALDRFKTAKPELFDYLSQLDDGKAAGRVADEFKDSFGVMRKFLDFLVTFRPEEPTPRPAWGGINWSDKSLQTILNVVYSYRSEALHEGKPFPAPMCLPPFRHAGQAPTERPDGDMSMVGGTWKAKDIPLLLHTFEYITRVALLKWWSSMCASEARGSA